MTNPTAQLVYELFDSNKTLPSNYDDGIYRTISTGKVKAWLHFDFNSEMMILTNANIWVKDFEKHICSDEEQKHSRTYLFYQS